jgi:PTH2 family peptidyl-tRNA hydrolase
LLELGFTEECARKALSLSGDLEKASEIALKLSDEGLEADLSAYVPEKPSYQLPSKFEKAKMMFIVNGELKMGKGKICAQVGHAVIGAYNQIEDEARFDEKSRARL